MDIQQVNPSQDTYLSLISKYNGNFVGLQNYLNSLGLVNTEDNFIAMNNQTVFDLSKSYIMGYHLLRVTVDGVVQSLGSGYNETSPKRFTFTEGLIAGQKVKAEYFDSLLSYMQALGLNTSENIVTNPQMQQNEHDRMDNENARQSNELQRQQDEDIRQQNEQVRVSNNSEIYPNTFLIEINHGKDLYPFVKLLLSGEDGAGTSGAGTAGAGGSTLMFVTSRVKYLDKNTLQVYIPLKYKIDQPQVNKVNDNKYVVYSNSSNVSFQLYLEFDSSLV